MSYTANSDRYTTMEYRHAGNSGLQLPVIALGLWHNFGTNAQMETMKQLCFTAFDQGITYFDLANNYGPERGSAETNFGTILHSDMSQYRDQMIIATKAGYTMWDGPYGNWGSRKYLLASLDQSLGRMGLDYVDIFYHHRMDPDTPLEETMSALDTAVKSGKALYAGLSNYNGETMLEAMRILQEMRCPFIINQNRYSMFDRTIEKNGLKAACAAEGKGIIAFSPLEQGLLSNRYLDGIPADSRIMTDGRFLSKEQVEATHGKVVALNNIASERGQTLAQMALSWVLRDGEVTSVLIGASKASQILDNCQIVGNTTFSAEELAKIDVICAK